MQLKKVLLYAEPHPLRNSFMEFLEVADFFYSSFLKISEPGLSLDWRLYSNIHVLSEVYKRHGSYDFFIYPDEETQVLHSLSLREWNYEAVSERQSLVLGDGFISEVYQKELDRIYSIYPFDAVVLWSENGAVRKYCQAKNIQIVHCELGPTRSPFPKTFYIDGGGTNGNGTLLNYQLWDYPGDKVVPCETWLSVLASNSAAIRSPKEIFYNGEAFSLDVKEKYVVVALQLADDLNTLSHSNFSSPTEFLEFLLPPLLGFGFQVFIKGHPAAKLRPYNLVHQLAALQYARGLGEGVVVLPHQVSSDEFISLISGAFAVCSINSSVSFEALISGVPAVVFGDAAFDLGGVLKRSGDTLVSEGVVVLPSGYIDRISSILFRHYLHPYNVDSAARVFGKFFMNFHAFEDDFAEGLVKTFDYGFDFVDQELCFSEESRFLFEEDKSILLSSKVMGNIDALDMKNDSSGGWVVLSVSGWVAFSCNSEDRILGVSLRISGEPYGAISRLMSRPDVQHVHSHVSFPCGFNIKLKIPAGIAIETLDVVMHSKLGAYPYSVDLTRKAPYTISCDSLPFPKSKGEQIMETIRQAILGSA